MLEAREYDYRLSDTLPELLEAIFKAVREKAGAFGRIEQGKRVEVSMIPTRFCARRSQMP